MYCDRLSYRIYLPCEGHVKGIISSLHEPIVYVQSRGPSEMVQLKYPLGEEDGLADTHRRKPTYTYTEVGPVCGTLSASIVRSFHQKVEDRVSGQETRQSEVHTVGGVGIWIGVRL